MNELIRAQADNAYTTLFFKDESKIMVTKSIKEFEGLLTDMQFYRVLNSHLINIGHIDEFVREGGGSLIMSDGTEILISRRRKDEFLKKLGEWRV